MLRLFKTHEIREQSELDGLWDFAPMAGEENPKEYSYSMPVPGCWEMHPDFLKYRGKGAYRRLIKIKEKSSVRLVFKGVSHTADIYFDGELKGHHYNAFTPFSIVIPAVEPGEHEMMVIADNTFSEKSALHMPNDYYSYGGLTRPVAMEIIPDTFIETVRFNPSMENGEWKAEIGIKIRNIGSLSEKISVKGRLGQYELDFGTHGMAAGGQMEVSKAFSFKGVDSWFDTNPKMYALHVKLYSPESAVPFDDLIERVGFRTVAVKDQKLLVNGREVKVTGFNRHEDHAIVGCAIPVQLMVKDIDLMQDMGANSVRTCHYPNDELFLDLCDERGLYVWEENHARGLSLEQMQNPNFERQCSDCIEEMIENHYNHPSIIVWGILNECASHTEEGRQMYKKQFEQIRSMDPSRPVTFASCQYYKDLCFDLVDIVSINLYAGWYFDEPVDQYYERIKAWIEKSGGLGKPIIISEFGGGAIYGYRDPARVKWSEERQADILEECLSVYLNRQEIVGTYIWQFCDCRVTEEKWALGRPRTKNNKGVVDEYRRPKLSYETVKKHFKGQGTHLHH